MSGDDPMKRGFEPGMEVGKVDIFLSYNHGDDAPPAADTGDEEEREERAGRARDLYDRLTAAGYTVAFDQDIQAGKDFETWINVNVARCQLLVALWSPRSFASEWCRYEAMRAHAEDKLLPVELEPITDDQVPPTLLGAASRSVRIDYDAPDLLEQIAARIGERRDAAERARLADARQRIAAGRVYLPEVLSSGQADLYGRDLEESLLLDAWASCAPGADAAKKTNIVVLHAIGGAGKTALMRRMVDRLAEDDFPHADKVIGWSAYSQGAGDNRNADADAFITEAITQMGFTGAVEGDSRKRADLLAALMQETRTLLLLDGIEPLQSLPVVDNGRLKDKPLAALLTKLARQNPGLVVVTSRQPLEEVRALSAPAIRSHPLEELSEPAGANYLKALGCWGHRRDLEAASGEADGHALTLTALGGFIAAVEGGDIRKRDHFALGEVEYTAEELAAPDATVQAAKKAGRVLLGYVKRFKDLEATRGQGEAEALFLNSVGLFDRPADGEAVRALLADPPIPRLTDVLADWSHQKRTKRFAAAKTRLRALKLIAPEDPADPDGLDAHPVVREHFAKALAEAAPEAFRAAHERLYRHYAEVKGLPEALRSAVGQAVLALHSMLENPAMLPQLMESLAAGTLPEEIKAQLPEALRTASPAAIAAIPLDQIEAARRALLPDTLAEMTPLFHAIGHGCAAGLAQEVWDDVYQRRVRRGAESFINKQLGAYAANLGALAAFFAAPWAELRPELTNETARSAALNYAASALRALARLREAEQAEAAGLSLDVAQGSWKNAAIAAGNVSELRLALGRVADAVAAGAEAVAHADRSRDAFQMMGKRTTHADALAQAGRGAEAAALFATAEARQAQMQPDLPRLYSLPGYRYCDLLLDRGAAAAVRERAGWMLKTYDDLNAGSLLTRSTATLAEARALALLAAHEVTLPSPGAAEGSRPGQGAPSAAASRPRDPSPRGEPGAQDDRDLGAAAEARLDAAVAALRQAGGDDDLPHGLFARAGFHTQAFARDGDPRRLKAAADDLAEAEDIASRGEMRLFLTDWRLAAARLALAQIPAAPPEWLVPLVEGEPAPDDPWPDLEPPAGLAAPNAGPSLLDRLLRRRGAQNKPEPAGPLTPDEERHRADAEAHTAEAAKLIQETGYHRRDRELADLRRRLDALAALT